MTEPTVDEPARRTIAEDLDRNLFVEAGAGSGKTTALVGRIVELVTSGRCDLEHLAAITFTEAAAAELRDRITMRLEDVARSGEVDPVRSERAREALGAVDGAAIATLHGFARRILSAHPFEAGLPPVFDVLDAGQSAVDFDERWNGFLDGLLADAGSQPALTRLLACGVETDDLRSVAEAFDGNWDQLVDHEVVGRPAPVVDGSAVLDHLDRAAGMTDRCTVPGGDELVRHIGSLAGFRDELRAATDEGSVLQLLVGSPRLTCSRGTKGNWSCPVADVRAELKDAEAARAGIVAAVAEAALSEVLPALQRLTLDGAAGRRAEGRLEFHDLLVLARQMVRNVPAARELLGREYERLLIDEFQDTDPIQAELAVRIAGGSSGPGDGSVPWEELDVEGGRLFFVGDPKQAIYRFRRADMGLFLRMRDRFAGDRLSLSVNFRSVPPVIDWVNGVFAELIGPGRPGLQPAYEGLDASLPAHDSPVPPVVLLGGAVGPGPDGKTPGVDVIRVAEARELAATMRRIRHEGWPVGPAGREHPARYRDQTVLVPTRTGLPLLLDALDGAGVPYRLESSSLVFASDEVQELLAVLRAVDDPADQVHLVAALRSPSFGCGDDDLVGYAAAGGAWDYLAVPPAAAGSDHPVVQAMGVLRELHGRRRWLDVSRLVEEVIDGRRMMELALDDRRARDTWRRLRFVADQARQFADDHGGDLHRFLAWATLQQEDRVKAVEVVLPESDDDAVRIMTVHASKGLEFPVVFLTGLNRTGSATRSTVVLWGHDGPEVKVNAAVRTGGYDERAALEKEADEAEARRLLYVAATRASDHLVVSLHHKAGATCAAALLEPLCDRPDVPCGRLPEEEVGAGTGGGGGATGGASGGATGGDAGLGAGGAGDDDGPDPDDDWSTRDAWIAGRERLVGPGARPRVLAATAVARLARTREEERRYPGDGPEPDDGSSDTDLPPWRRGRAGTAVGRAVHGTLQVVDLATGGGLEEIARAQANAEGVGGRWREVRNLASAALGSELVRQAVDAGRFWRELYVGAPVTDGADGPVVEGIVDLLFETPDGFTVVDYKTDAAGTDEELDAAFGRYVLQGATYALAVGRAVGRPVTRCAFLFLREDGAVVREIPDLPAAVERVAAALGDAGSGVTATA